MQTGWIGSAAALLVQLQANGQINLFGLHSDNGFADLAALDVNGDGIIDSRDAAFEQLRAWFDVNKNGVVDAGELRTLSEIGIVSIGVNPVASGQTIDGNTIVGSAGVSFADGTTAQIDEVNFMTKGEHSIYTPPVGFQTDDLAKILPQIHGYGSMPDLQVSMSLDPTLESMVLQFVFSAPSMSPQEFDAGFTDILYRWAGVDGVDPNAWGSFVDGRQYEFVLKIFGIDPNGINDYTAADPNWHNGPIDAQLFQTIKSVMEVRFAAQLGPLLSAIFPSDALASAPFAAFANLNFNSTADSVSLNFKPLLTAIAQGAPSDPTSASNYYGFVGLLLSDLATDVSNRLGQESGLLLSRIMLDGAQAGLSSSTLQKIATSFTSGTVSVIDLNETTGTYVTAQGTNIFTLGSAFGSASAPNDPPTVLEINGNGSADNFVFWSNYGGNVVFADANASLDFADLLQSDVAFQRRGDDLVIVVNSSGLSITLSGEFTNAALSSIQFADNKILSANDIVKNVPYYVGAGDITLQVPDGDVTVVVGMGNDVLTGGRGNQTFIYGSADGNLTVNDHDADYQGDLSNTLKLTDLNPNDVTLSRNGANDLIVTIDVTGKVITVSGNFNSPTHDGVQQIVFADGTTWNRQQITALAPVYAGSGDVTLTAPLFDDIALEAGSGNDTFIGGRGNAIFIYGSADGNLTVNAHDADYQGALFNTLKLTDLNAGDVTLSRDTANDLLVTVNATGKVITVTGTFNSLVNDGVQQIVFADGTTWNRDQITAAAPLRAGPSNVTLTAPPFDNVTLEAGPGDDTFIGGRGNAIFIYGSADGNLTVNAHDADYQGALFNTLKLTDLNAGDVTLSRDTANDLLVTVNATGKVITVTGTFNSLVNDGVQQIVFADGTTWNRDQITAAAPLRAGPSNVTLTAPPFDNVTLEAGPGDDTFIGGRGNAIFIYGSADGNLTVNAHDVDYQGALFNTLKLTDLNAGDVTLSRDTANDLLVTVNATGKVITVTGTFNSLVNDGVQQIVFADGTTWNRDRIANQSPIEVGVGDVAFILPDGDVTAVAGPGNDILNGGTGSDTFNAGVGNDTFNGGVGNDTFIYAAADGNLTFNDNTFFRDPARFNTLKLTDLNVGDVTLSRDSANDLLVTINATGRVITITGNFNSTDHDGVQQIVFADGTTWNRDQITAAAPVLAGPSDVTLRVPDGDVAIAAGPGNDTFNGGVGNDTFIYAAADGNLTVNDSAYFRDPARFNTLKLSDLNAGDVTLSRDSANDLLVTVNATGKVITVTGNFNSLDHDGVQQIVFADGTSLNRDQITAAAPVLAGPSDVTLRVPDGDVAIAAGPGNDTFNGGVGNDTFIYAAADGNLTVNDNAYFRDSARFNTLKLSDLDVGDVTLSRDSANDLLVTVNATGKVITVTGTFNSLDHDGVQQIVFADGTSLNRDQITAAAPVLAGPGDVTLRVPDGNVAIAAGPGNDTFNGGVGNDTFIYAAADGNLTVNDNAYFRDSARFNTLKLSDLNVGDVTLSRDSANDLLVTVNATGKVITVTGTFNSTDHDGVQSLVFADGTTWNRDQITAAAPLLAGPSDVTLRVPDGDVAIAAGPGNDTFNGGVGNDTFIYAAADGNLTVNDNAYFRDPARFNTLKLSDLNAGDVTLSRDLANDLLVTVNATGRVITITGNFNSTDHDGVQSIVFADGMSLNRDQIVAAAPVRVPDAATSTYVHGSGVRVDVGKGGGYFTHNSGETNQTYLWAKGDGNDDLDLYTPTGSTDVLNLTDVNASDVQLSRSGVDLLVTVLSTGETIKVANQWYDATDHRGVTLAFADGTTLDRDQIAAAAATARPRYTPSPGTALNDLSDSTIVLGPGDGTTINGARTSQGLQLDWSSTSGSTSGWWWSNGNDAGGSDPSMLNLTDLIASDVTLGRMADGGSDDLIVTNKTTGKTLTLYHQFSGYPYDDVGSIHFADGTVLSHDQVAAAAHFIRTPYSPAAGTTLNDLSDKEITLGPGDGTTINGARTSQGLQLDWSSTSGSASGWWWSYGNDAGGSDSSVLNLTDLNASDVTLGRIADGGSDDLVVTNKATGKTLTLYHQFSGAPYDDVGSIRFADGTVLNHDQIAASVTSFSGSAGNDNVSYPGLSGTTFDFGAGNDTYFDRGVGGNTFIYASGDGSDTYDIYASGVSTNQLDLLGLNADDLTFSRSGTDLLAQVNGTADVITIKEQFNTVGNGIASINFGDGTTWNRDQIAANAWYRAGAGDATVTAGDGNATLAAGAGNDTLIGGAGNDRFVYAAANGNLTIQDHADPSAPARSNTLSFTDLNAADISLTRSNDDLVVAIQATGKSVTVAGEFASPDHDGVQQIGFADGSSWTASDILNHLHQPAG